MRTRLALLSAAFVALVSLSGSATAQTPVNAEAAPSSLIQSVVVLSDTIDARIDGLQTEIDRLEDEARFRRIVARRGRRLQPGWYARQARSTRSYTAVASAPIAERSVSYGSYSGSVNPLILSTIMGFNQDISAAKAASLAGLIQTTADRYGVDPLLVTALVSQESAFYQSAQSPVGATGLGQLMPDTAAELGVNPRNAQQNLDGSVRYLADLLYHWSGSADPTALALASYNAGAGNVEAYNGVPPFEETVNYVAVIKDRYATLSSGHAVLNG